MFIALIIAFISYLFFHYQAATIADLLPDKITAQEVYYLGIALAVGGLINIPLAWLRITENAILFFKVTMVKVIIQVALSIYWLSTGMGVTSVLAAGAVSAVLVALYLTVFQIKATNIHFSITSLICITKYAGPIFIGGLTTFALSGMDRWVLAEYFGAKEIASYTIAIKFALVPALLIQPFTLWWFPKRYSVLNEKNGRELNAHFSILGSIISVLICGAIGLIGPFLIKVLTPTEFHGAIILLPWLLLCTLLKMISELLNLGCFIKEDSQTQMRINFLSCGIGGMLLLILVPQLMVVGAIASLLIANLLRLVLFYHYSQKQLYLPYKFGYLFTACGTTFIAMWLGQHIESHLWLASN